MGGSGDLLSLRSHNQWTVTCSCGVHMISTQITHGCTHKFTNMCVHTLYVRPETATQRHNKPISFLFSLGMCACDGSNVAESSRNVYLLRLSNVIYHLVRIFVSPTKLGPFHICAFSTRQGFSFHTTIYSTATFRKECVLLVITTCRAFCIHTHIASK